MRIAMFKVEGCRVGQKIAEDIFTKSGAVLIPKDYIITERVLSIIKANDVATVKIYLEEGVVSEYEVHEEEELTPSEALQKTIEEYKFTRYSDILKIEETFFDVSKGKPVQKTVLDNLSGSIKASFDTRLIPYVGSIKVSDNYTLEHSLNMGTLALMFAKWMGFDKEKTDNFIQSALLHDIGRAKVNPDILNKPGKLTPAEFEEVKQHPTHSYRMLQESTEIHKDIKMGVLMHHERADGSGYPLGAKDAQIHQFAKLLAILDTYDAMTTDRIYKPKFFALKVLDELYQCSFGKLEYAYVNVFIKNMLNYYTGCTVRLNTGEIGNLVHIDVTNVTKPIVKIDSVLVDLKDESGVELEAFV